MWIPEAKTSWGLEKAPMIFLASAGETGPKFQDNSRMLMLVLMESLGEPTAMMISTCGTDLDGHKFQANLSKFLVETDSMFGE